MTTQTAIVLQGGGALGAYEWGVLTYLYNEANFQPNIVAGVSIGAITATTIVAPKYGNPVRALERLWDQLVTPDVPGFAFPFLGSKAKPLISALGNRHFFVPRLDYSTLQTWTSLYDLRPLKRTLDEVVDWDALRTSSTTLLLTATNVESGKIEVFSNRTHDIAFEHVVASGSLPPGFPMTRIGKSYYWDGGLFDNTPLASVLERLDPSEDVEKSLYVINLFPTAGTVPSTMSEVFDRMLQILFSNKIDQDVSFARALNEIIDFVDMLDDVPNAASIKAMPGYKRVALMKLIRNIIYVRNHLIEPSTACFDFSRSSVDARYRAGLADAEITIEKFRQADLLGGAEGGPASRVRYFSNETESRQNEKSQ
jgi:predicted acylesterase/phospholipase RssA